MLTPTLSKGPSSQMMGNPHENFVGEPAYGIGRPAMTQGYNAKFSFQIEEEVEPTISSLIETLAAFEKEGICMNGLTTVNARHTDWKTGEHARIPAIKMEVR